MLTDENKAFILKKINEGIQDYVVLANLLYNREDLTGRSKEAKQIGRASCRERVSFGV